jgi:ribosomal protein L28
MRSCDLCDRGTGVMQKQSHSQVKHKTHQKINVQVKRMDGGSLKLCSRCMKTINKVEKEIEEKQTKKTTKPEIIEKNKSYNKATK